MAKAHKSTITITKMVKTAVKVNIITLTLTKKEAVVLHEVLGYVGGSQRQSARKYSQQVRDALTNVDGNNYNLSVRKNVANGIYFNNESYEELYKLFGKDEEDEG